MKKGFILSLILAITFVSGLVGCSPKADKGKTAVEKVLNLNITGEPTSLDPAKAFDTDTLEITNNLFEGLTRLDANHEPKPAVAKEINVSPDGLTYTFKLNKTKWSNGDDVTAHDFEFAWKRALDPKTAADGAFLMYFIQGAEAYNTGKGSVDQVGVKAIDDATLEVKLVRPQPSFLQLTAYPTYFPINKKAFEKDQNLFAEAKTYVSNGAFKLAEWKHDAELKLVKNDNYYKKDQVKLSGLHYAIVTDSKTIYQLYQTKKLDRVDKSNIPADLLAGMIKSGEVKPTDGSGLQFFRFNVEKKPFNNAKIRKAFALAIDRKTITEQITGGGEKPAYGYVAWSVPNNFRQKNGDLIKDAQYDEAKKLLEEGMKEEGLTQLPEITLLHSTSRETNKKIAEAIQEMYRKHLGVEIKIISKEKKVFFEDQDNKNFMMIMSSFVADYNDAYNYLESFQTNHGFNLTNWSNKKYDELVQKAANSAKQEERDMYLMEAEKILLDEMPVVPSYFYSDAVLQQPNVSGIIRHPVGPTDFSQADKK